MARSLKVGFDLDGVILYNPARIIRPLMASFKKLVLKKKKLRFYVPKTNWEKQLWHLFHKSSLFLAPGFHRIEEMVKAKKIEAYIITARYNFLKDDFHTWVQKMGAHTYCVAYHHNESDNQPHLYKEEMVRRYDLDVFVEDNLDIVLHLKKTFPEKEIIWIYNMLDKKIQYEPKYPNLQLAIDHINSYKKKP